MADSTIRVREATASDSEAIAALLAELGYPIDSAEVPSRLAAVAGDRGATFVAVDDEDAPLGLVCLTHFVSLHAPGPIAYITTLVTSSAARRRGVGQLLVAGAKSWAAQHGCVRLSVTSAERRADAHAFYPACGLPYTGRRFATPISPG
jgi:GNAT superfamily N-acetyltransferase